MRKSKDGAALWLMVLDSFAAKRERNLVFVEAQNGKPAYWQTEITLNYRRVRRFAGHTKEEARGFLAELRVAAREKKLDERLKPVKPGDTFGEYARALLDSTEWKSKRSASRNEFSLKKLNHAFKDVQLAEVSPGLVRRYVTERREDDMSPATINREISLLKSILYAAEYDGLIASNPIRGRRVKKLEEANSREKIILSMSLAHDDIMKLMDCAAPHFKPILQLALVCGMRKGEILGLKWKDLDFTFKKIRIRAENAKSKRERFVPVDAETLMTLDSIERKSEYVFVNSLTGERQKNFDEAFRAACERAKIPTGRRSGLVFHDLRHLAAYRLVKVTDIVTASKILGHASIQMTMRYVHPTEKDAHEAIEKAAENLYQGRQKDVNDSKPSSISETVDHQKSLYIHRVN